MEIPTLFRLSARWVLLGVAAVIAIGAQARAQESGPGARPPHSLQAKAPRSRSRWTNGVGSALRKGAHQAGYALGAGFGTKTLGSHDLHNLALGTARYGWILGGMGGDHRWYHGNPEVLIELFGGIQTNPTGQSLYGVTPLLRYNFVTGSRWVPFLNGGVGAAYTTIRHPDLSTSFEFNVQLGIGAHYFLNDNRALTVQYRWFHLSNAGIKLPNSGTNTQMLFAGLDWFY
jgi:opacity protein-like surface antigen